MNNKEVENLMTMKMPSELGVKPCCDDIDFLQRVQEVCNIFGDFVDDVRRGEGDWQDSEALLDIISCTTRLQCEAQKRAVMIMEDRMWAERQQYENSKAGKEVSHEND